LEAEVSEAAAVQRQFADRTLIDYGRDGGGLGFNQRRLIGNGDGFRGSGNCQLESQLEGATDVHVQCGRDLWRHSNGFGASGVISWWKQLKSKAAFKVG